MGDCTFWDKVECFLANNEPIPGEHVSDVNVQVFNEWRSKSPKYVLNSLETYLKEVPAIDTVSVEFDPARKVESRTNIGRTHISGGFNFGVRSAREFRGHVVLNTVFWDLTQSESEDFHTRLVIFSFDHDADLDSIMILASIFIMISENLAEFQEACK